MSAPRGWPADGRVTVTHADRGSSWPVVLDVPGMAEGAYLVDAIDEDGALFHGTGGRVTPAQCMREAFVSLVVEKVGEGAVTRAQVDAAASDRTGEGARLAADAIFPPGPLDRASSAAACLLMCFPPEWWGLAQGNYLMDHAEEHAAEQRGQS